MLVILLLLAALFTLFSSFGTLHPSLRILRHFVQMQACFHDLATLARVALLYMVATSTVMVEAVPLGPVLVHHGRLVVLQAVIVHRFLRYCSRELAIHLTAVLPSFLATF